MLSCLYNGSSSKHLTKTVRYTVVTTTELYSPCEPLFILLYIPLLCFAFLIYQYSKIDFYWIKQKQMRAYERDDQACIISECDSADLCSGGVRERDSEAQRCSEGDGWGGLRLQRAHPTTAVHHADGLCHCQRSVTRLIILKVITLSRSRFSLNGWDSHIDVP